MPGPEEAAKEAEEIVKELSEAEKAAAATRGSAIRALLMTAAEGASADLREAARLRAAGEMAKALERAQAAQNKILAVLALETDAPEALPHVPLPGGPPPTAPSAMLGSTTGVPVLRAPLPGEAAAAAWMQKAGFQLPSPAPSPPQPSGPGVFGALWRGVLSVFRKTPVVVAPPPAPAPPLTVEIGTVLEGPSGRVVLRGEFPNPQAAGKAYKDMLKFSQEQQRLMMQAQVEHDRALAQAAAADQAAVERARSEGLPESWIDRALANRQPRVIQIMPPAPPPFLPSPPAAAPSAIAGPPSGPPALPSPQEVGRGVAAAVAPPPLRPISGARVWFKRFTWAGGLAIGGFALIEGILSSRARSKTFVYEDIKQLGMGVQFSILHAKDPEPAERLARLYWDEALPTMGDNTFWSWVPFVNQLTAFKQYAEHSKEYMRALEEALPALEMTPAAREAWKAMTPSEKLDYARRVAEEVERARPAGATETRVPPAPLSVPASAPSGGGVPAGAAVGGGDEGRLTDEEFRSLTPEERAAFLPLRGAARRNFIREFRAKHPVPTSTATPPGAGAGTPGSSETAAQR